MLKLIIEDDEGRKTVVPFARDEITIGRQEGNTIRLTERNVSRRHARLLRQNGHVLIEDLGSYNGIRINGDRIAGQVQINDGDLIQIGDYDLALQDEDAQPTMPLDPALRPGATPPAPAPMRKGSEAAATLPAMPAVEAPQEAADEDVRDANDEGEVGADAPPSLPRHQSTAVIRVDQLEPSRKRPVEALDAAEAPRLVVLNTDFAGREFPCGRTELTVGRTDDNDVALDHRSLSRTHCKLVREDSGEWKVIDLQSANGLMVNGETYAQATLRFGDVIELGHVKLKFVGPGEQVEVAPTTSSPVTVETEPEASSRVPLFAVAAALLVILVGGGGYALWKSGQGVEPKPRPPPDPVVRTTPPRPPPEQPRPVEPVQPAVDPAVARQAVEEKLKDARAAIDVLDWEKATALLREATIDGSQHPEARQLLTQMEGERGFKTALEQAEALLDGGELDKAKVQLDAATGTRLLRPHYEALEARRAQLVKEKLAVKKGPEPKGTPKATPKGAEPGKGDPRLVEAEALFKEASDERKAKNYERAAVRLERCMKTLPTYHPCYRLAGSVYASIASRDQSAADMERAKKYYERFLEVAPPDDEYVVKVRNILEQAKSQ